MFLHLARHSHSRRSGLKDAIFGEGRRRWFGMVEPTSWEEE
jgi:hypothetical protein